MEEDGLPQPPPGAGAGLVVSLLPKPDIYLGQETRVHETESSWGWTYGNENTNNCCCFLVFLCLKSNLNLSFVVGPENQSGNNFTPQTTFRPYITGIVPSHPGGSGVECTIKLWDARYLIFPFNLSSFSSGTWRLFSLWSLWCPSRRCCDSCRSSAEGEPSLRRAWRRRWTKSKDKAFLSMPIFTQIWGDLFDKEMKRFLASWDGKEKVPVETIGPQVDLIFMKRLIPRHPAQIFPNFNDKKWKDDINVDKWKMKPTYLCILTTIWQIENDRLGWQNSISEILLSSPVCH